MEIWVTQLRFCGTFALPTAGHLPIANKFVIFYDKQSLTNETRSQPGLGITLTIRES
jgi:hypothetical protein